MSFSIRLMVCAKHCCHTMCLYSMASLLRIFIGLLKVGTIIRYNLDNILWFNNPQDMLDLMLHQHTYEWSVKKGEATKSMYNIRTCIMNLWSWTSPVASTVFKKYTIPLHYTKTLMMLFCVGPVHESHIIVAQSSFHSIFHLSISF
jgi:hypothetical protein